MVNTTLRVWVEIITMGLKLLLILINKHLHFFEFNADNTGIRRERAKVRVKNFMNFFRQSLRNHMKQENQNI